MYACLLTSPLTHLLTQVHGDQVLGWNPPGWLSVPYVSYDDNRNVHI